MINGFVDDLAINPSLLSTGHSPIVGISGAGLQVSGKVFGAEISGGLFLDTIAFNADNTVDATPNTTPPAFHMLYGGIEASIDLEGLAGFQLRLGLYQDGPLEVYVQADVPILLDPSSGLTLGSFFGSVDFGKTLPGVTDPKNGFSPTGPLGSEIQLLTEPPGTQQSITQWKTQLAGQVASLVKDVGNTTPDFSQLTKHMTIAGGATLYSEYASSNAFELTGGIAVDTVGHVLMAGSLTLGDTFSLQAEAYFNFAQVEQGQAQVLVHAAFPAPTPGSSSPPPLVTAWGELAISYTSGNVTPISGQNVGSTGPALASALQFNNASTADNGGDYVQSNAPVDLNNTSFSVEFWAQQKVAGAQDLIGQSGQPSGLRIGFDGSGRLVAKYGSTTVAATNVADQKWHQWAVTYDAGSGAVTIYRDGESSGTGSFGTGLSNLSGAFLIGKSGDAGAAGFVGSIDEVRVWTIVLAQTAIQANMDRSNLGGSTGLVADWTFDEGSPGSPEENKTAVTDVSGRGNGATLYVGSAPPDWTTVMLVTLPQVSSGTTLTITLSGGVDLGVKPVALEVTGSAAFSYTHVNGGPGVNPETDVALTVSGTLPLAPLGDLADVAGTVELVLPNDDITQAYLYGAVYATPGDMFSKLKNLGVTLSGFAYLDFNTSADTKTVKVKPPNHDEQTIKIDPESATIWVHGAATFSKGGTSWFGIDNADLFIHFGEAPGGFQFQVYVSGTLELGPPDAPIFSLDAWGYLQIDSSGIAAELDASFATGGASKSELSVDGTVFVELNTTDKTITFTPPTTIQTSSDGASKSFDSGSSDSTITIADRPTLPDGTKPDSAEPYFLANITADVSLLNGEFVLNGMVDLVVAPNLLTLSFDAGLNMNLPNGTTVLTGTATGGLTIDAHGMVGAVDVEGISFNAGILSINAAAKLEINTTGVSAVVGAGTPNPITVPAGAGGFFAELSATGDLTIKDQTIANASIDVTITGGAAVIVVHGGVNVPVLGDVTVDGTLGIITGAGGGVYGGLSIVEQTKPGGFQDLLQKIGLNFSQSAEFQFELNTTASDQYFTGFTVDKKTGDITTGQQITVKSDSFALDMGGSLTLFNNGFHLAGDFGFSFSTSNVSFYIDGSVALLGQSISFSKSFSLDTNFVLYADVNLNTSLSFGGAVPLTVGGELVFGINATGGSVTEDGGAFTMPAHSGIVGIKNFSVQVGAFRDTPTPTSSASFDTSLLITVQNGDFTFAWRTDVSADFIVDGVDLFSFDVSGGMSVTIGYSNGAFTFGGSVDVSVKWDGHNVGSIKGSLYTSISTDGIHVEADGTVSSDYFPVKHSYSGSIDFSTSRNSSHTIPTPRLNYVVIHHDGADSATVDSVILGEQPTFEANVTDGSIGGGIYLKYVWRMYTPSNPYNAATDPFKPQDPTTWNSSATASYIDGQNPNIPSGTSDFSPAISFDFFRKSGTYTVVLKVFKYLKNGTATPYGDVVSFVKNFTVRPPAVTVQDVTGASQFEPLGTTLNLSGTVTTDDVDQNTGKNGNYYEFYYEYDWTIIRDGVPLDPQTTYGWSDPLDPSTATVAPLSFQPTATGRYTVTLTARLVDRLSSQTNDSYPSPLFKKSFLVVPAGNVLTVDSTNDSPTFSSNGMTLREALAIANQDPGTWTIDFAPSLTGETIDLSSVGDDTIGASALAIAARNNVTIDASAAPGLTIERAADAPAMRLFYVPQEATLAVDDLTLRGGLAMGGAPVGAGGGGAGLGGAIYDAGVPDHRRLNTGRRPGDRRRGRRKPILGSRRDAEWRRLRSKWRLRRRWRRRRTCRHWLTGWARRLRWRGRRLAGRRRRRGNGRRRLHRLRTPHHHRQHIH